MHLRILLLVVVVACSVHAGNPAQVITESEYSNKECPAAADITKCVSDNECKTDSDCKKKKKCCEDSCGKNQCVKRSKNRKRKGKCPKEDFGTCDVPRDPCNNDFDCDRKEKCCDRACGGKECRRAIIDGESKKIFKCPARWTRNRCYSDENCKGNKKCCPNDCGYTSCKRSQKYKGERVCPAETVTLPLKDECFDDDECTGRRQKCCPNECGVRTCTGAQAIDCATVRCADPNCGPGEITFTPKHSCCQSCKKDCQKISCLNPVCHVGEERVIPEGECCYQCDKDKGERVCPAETVTLPLKDECFDDDECTGRRQKCCPNECGVRTCTGAQAIDCATVRCADPNCGPGEITFTPKHSCCQSCKKDCQKISCLNPVCHVGEERVIPEGECCYQCDKDCKAVICLNPVCEKDEIKEVPKGECCPRCKKDCSTILCPAKQCLPNQIKYRPEGECCDSCKDDCSKIKCASPNCGKEEIEYIPEGKCCKECKKGVCNVDGKWYDVGDSFKDDCNTCGCQKGGHILCTLIACAPCTVTVGGLTLVYPSGTAYHDGCNTCTCSNGVPACSKKLCSGCPTGLPTPTEDVCIGKNPPKCPANHDCDYLSGYCCRVPTCNFPLLTTHCSNDLACPSGYYCTDFVEKRLDAKGFCCLDCRTVKCAEPVCEKGYVPYYPEGECCKQCKKDCSTAICPKPVCNFGEEWFTPPDSCCPICKHPDDCYDDRTDVIYPDGAQFQYQCNGCFCSGGVIGCTKIGCDSYCESGLKPLPKVSCADCQLDGYSCENKDKCCKVPSCPGTLEWISQTYCNSDKTCPNGYGCYYPGSEINGFCCQGCQIQDDFIAPGEHYRVDDCMSCTCQKGESLACYLQDCPAPPCENPVKIEGQCCKQCIEKKPCIFDELLYEHGEEFYDDCNGCSCSDGLVTCTRVGCKNDGCYFEGTFYAAGYERNTKKCGKCSCVKDGNNYVIKCTQCCVIDDRTFPVGTWIPRINPCKSCTCVSDENSEENYVTELCAVQACPKLECPKPIKIEGQCCEECLGKPCESGGLSYQDGDRFYDECNECTCEDGQPVCTEQACGGEGCYFEGHLYEEGEDLSDVVGCDSCVCVKSEGGFQIQCAECCVVNSMIFEIGDMIPRADPCQTDCTCVKRDNSAVAEEECSTIVCAQITCDDPSRQDGGCCGPCLDAAPEK